MNKKPPVLSIEQLLQVMQGPFERRFSCQISFYTGDYVAAIHFFSDEPLGDPLLCAWVYPSGEYSMHEPTWKRTNIHPLTVAMKRADTLLGLLKALYQS